MTAPAPPFGDFGVTVDFVPDGPNFAAGRAVVGVRGEVDMVTAPELSNLLEALADRGHVRLTLDLAELEFLDASGLRMIADVAALVGPAGSLSLRAVPAITRRILDLTGVASLVVIAPAGDDADATGRAAGGRAALATAFVSASASPATDVIDAALGLVAALARATVVGTDGVGVSLHRYGQLSTVASTDDTVERLDREQYTTGQGPCVAATAEGRRFHVASTVEDTRWPAFIPAAVAAGMGSVLSTPLLAAARPIGALNLYSRTVGAFGPDQQVIAGLLADQASAMLTLAGAGLTADGLNDRLDDALRARELIAHGQGVLMERHGISADAAHAMLRRAARRAGRPVRAQAAEVLASARQGSPPATIGAGGA